MEGKGGGKGWVGWKAFGKPFCTKVSKSIRKKRGIAEEQTLSMIVIHGTACRTNMVCKPGKPEPGSTAL
eukprot:763724-Hanusia_phi.AAC.8